MFRRFIFRRLIIIIFLFLNFIIFPQEDLPQPKNSRLFTEFVSYRYAPYLKKPLTGTGYIVMDGKNRFIFKQVKPVIIEVKKIDDKTTFKRGNTEPIEVNEMENELFFLFGDQTNIRRIYDISKKVINNKDNYYVVPKNKKDISNIFIVGIEDKFERIEINFNDNSKIIYEFKNTVTGIKPDEKFF